ncbi:hypothetical protein ACET3Z_007929 [Daucus carota]
MAHPIHQANKNSPYGDLNREQFHERHQIIHQCSYMLNKQNMKIWTQFWRPDLTILPRLRGIVAMIHGYASESSWLFELTAVGIAKTGFMVCALDLQGHGYSDGCPGHFSDIHILADDCIQFFDSVKNSNPRLPAFLYGESLGGAVAIYVCLKQPSAWNGLILNGAMCGISENIKPMWPLEKLFPLVACVAPNSKIGLSPGNKSFKEAWKRKLVSKSPGYDPMISGKSTVTSTLHCLRACRVIERDCHKLELPMLLVHGGHDEVCDPGFAVNVFRSASSTDKSLKIFEGMWHMLIGETNESVETVFQTIVSWIAERADRAKVSSAADSIGFPREQFYKKHQIFHQQSHMLNKQSMKIWTQSWCPYPITSPQIRGIVAMIHGYASESSWLLELTAVGIAKTGFMVCALDLQGHGYSDGCPGHLPDIHILADDCIQFFDSVKNSNPNLPAFIYGESIGGAIAVLVCLKQRISWNGLVLNGAMCGLSRIVKPIWPVEKLLPLVASIAPNWEIGMSPGNYKSYKEVWKRRLVSKSPGRNRVISGRSTAASTLQCFRAWRIIEREGRELKLPMLIVHGGHDEVCDPVFAVNVYESASSADKSLKIFEGMWHMLIGEPNESVERVFQTIVSWIAERADKANVNPPADFIGKRRSNL